MDSRAVPGALIAAQRRWLASGRPPQHPIAWRLTPWQRTLPAYAGFFATLPNPIGRAKVIELCEAADSSEGAAVRGFLAAMVWGYGHVGYGPYRTALVLSNNAEAHSVLRKAAHLAKNEGGLAAFEWMAQHRLRGLGVAFATKYLFFCAANGQGQPALILDRLVQGWLLANAHWRMRLEWRVRDYSDYIATIEDWARQLGLEPADVEFLIFAEAASANPTGQWNQTMSSFVTIRNGTTPIRAE